MYTVNALSANLDKSCSHVIVTTPAVNTALEAQAYSRVIRVILLLGTSSGLTCNPGVTEAQSAGHLPASGELP